MDTRNQTYYGMLKVSGHGIRRLEPGPITKLASQLIMQLVTMNPQFNAEGLKTIDLSISDKPIDDSKEATDKARKVSEVEAGIDWDQKAIDKTKPREGELFEDYYNRLITEHSMYPAAASFMACDWFEREQDPSLQAWMEDENAIRFRLLNSSHEAYESALPNEYPTLRHYCVQNFPQFVSLMTLREA